MTKSARKQNREGTIYFDEKSGSWRGELSWVDKSGKLQRKSWKSKKQMVIKAKMNEFKRQLLLNEGNCTPSTTMFEEYANHWLETVLKPQLKPSSYARKEVTLQNQVYPHIGQILIANITSNDIKNMIAQLSRDGLSYSTIKKAYEAVNACFKAYMVETQTLMYNPCNGVKLPSANRKEVSEITFFDKDQREAIEKEATRTFSNGAPVYRLGHAIVLLMYTGLRIGELIALKWSDIDFEDNSISVSRNAVVVKVDGKHQIVNQATTKTKSGARVIPISQKARLSLEALKAITGDEEFVLCTKGHQQVSPRNINRMFHNILSRVGIMGGDSDDSYGVHVLRHTFASMLFQNGCDVKVVSELLGHADTKITENIYIHVIQKQKVKAIQDIDRYSL